MNVRLYIALSLAAFAAAAFALWLAGAGTEASA